MRLPSNNEMLMCKIIEQEIDLIRQLEHIKAVLQREPGFNSFAIFREIDVDGDGQVNKEEVGEFLKEAGYEANESECLAIVRRMDTNGNWHVSYEEFIDFLTILEPAPRPIQRSLYRPRYVAPYQPKHYFEPYKYWDSVLGRFVYENPYQPASVPSAPIGVRTSKNASPGQVGSSNGWGNSASKQYPAGSEPRSFVSPYSRNRIYY